MEPAYTWNNVHVLMGEVRVMARRLLRCESHAQSLRVSELVLSGLRRQKRVDQEWGDVAWQNREHFFAAMYRAMDRALKDYGRRRNAHKRKAQNQITLDDITPDELLGMAWYQPQDSDHAFNDIHAVLIDILADALIQMEKKHPDWAQIARHRYYAGLTIEQIAGIMGMSTRTVRRHWEKARILLQDEIVKNLHNEGYDMPIGPRRFPAIRHPTL